MERAVVPAVLDSGPAQPRGTPATGRNLSWHGRDDLKHDRSRLAIPRRRRIENPSGMFADRGAGLGLLAAADVIVRA